MSLPAVVCPNCNATMSLDALLGHQGARDALLALATLHKGSRLQMVALRYVGLFAPAKQAMRMDRVADLLRELAELLAPATVEWKGQTFSAPMDYWIDAMEDMAGRRADLDLPMKGHGYLRSMVAGFAGRSAHQAEKAREDAAAGRTPLGLPAPAPAPRTPAVPEPPRRRAPDGVFQSMRDAMKGLQINHEDKEPPDGKA